MPRVFNNAVQGEIDKKFAGEPMVIIEVEWERGVPVAYSDRKLNGLDYPYPLILNISRFDSSQITSGVSDSQQTTITMNDIDGSLRSLIDAHDSHLKPVKIYLSFQGLNLASKALLFEGVINSPVVWDEGGRTLTFDVLSSLESIEAGFMMEDGNFPFVPESQRNEPWPLVFGEVCNMKPVSIETLVKGITVQGMGVPDPTLNDRLCQAGFLHCPKIKPPGDIVKYWSTWYSYDELTAACRDGNFGCGFMGGLMVDQLCMRERFFEICSINREIASQGSTVVNPFTVSGGNDFPQNEEITVKIGEVRFTGTMTGESFLVRETIHPQSLTIENPECKFIEQAASGVTEESRIGSRGTNDSFTVGGTTSNDSDKGPKAAPNLEECDNGAGFTVLGVVGGAKASWDYFRTFTSGDFIWLPPGSEVFLDQNEGAINIVSLLPGTVTKVAAYRTYGDTSLLSEVDPSFYTIVTTDFGGYDVVEVRLNTQLSLIEGEVWDDEIFVSFISSIGPNPADIIEWIVERYTDLTVDNASFASVRTDLANYPANFFIKQRPKVLDLVRDIAFQSRCGVFIRDNTIHLVYLSREPNSLKTLTEDDILPNSFKISHTPTEELQTRHNITWSKGDAQLLKDTSIEENFVLKHNVPKYGIFEGSYDYSTYNIFELVEKSATFWMIRNATTWKHVEFETPLVCLNLQIFDCVTISLSQFPTTKVIIEETNYNPDTNTISFRAWTPIRSGESTPYVWAWPSQQLGGAIFPLIADSQVSGDGDPLEVVPPIGHPLRAGFKEAGNPLPTDGDRFPSDLDDTTPTIDCPLATGLEFQDIVEPVFRPLEPLAEREMSDGFEGQDVSYSMGGDGDDEDDDDPNDNREQRKSCGIPVGAQCMYEVSIQTVTPDDLADPCNNPGPCTRTGGRPCTGGLVVKCHTFQTLQAADSFLMQQAAESTRLYDGCLYTQGQPAPYAVEYFPKNIKAVDGPGFCPKLDDKGNPLPGQSHFKVDGECKEDPGDLPEPQPNDDAEDEETTTPTSEDPQFV